MATAFSGIVCCVVFHDNEGSVKFESNGRVERRIFVDAFRVAKPRHPFDGLHFSALDWRKIVGFVFRIKSDSKITGAIEMMSSRGVRLQIPSGEALRC